MIKSKLLLLLSIIIITLLFANIPVHSQTKNYEPFTSVSNPNTFGQMADNGVIFAVWYSSFLTPYQNAQNQNIRTNTVYLTFANPYNYSMNMQITLELLNPNNLTDVQYTNTVNYVVNAYSINSFSLNLPVNKGHFDAIVSYKNLQVNFAYNPSIALLPANINSIGQESIFVIENIGISFIVLMFASVASELMLKRMYYFPKKSISSYILVLIGFFAIMFIWLNALFYYIVAIPYYYYFIPLFIIGLFFELSIRHRDIPESIFISISTNKNDVGVSEIPVFDDEYYIIPRKNNFIVINKDSFTKAFKRLFGFYTYLDMPNNIVKYPNLSGKRYYYFLKPSPNYKSAIIQKEFPAKSRLDRIFNKLRTRAYLVNLSDTSHLGDVLRVMSGIKTIEELAKQKKSYLDELTDLKIQIQNATITANFQWLFKLSMLIENIKDLIPENEYNLIINEIQSKQKEFSENKNTEPDNTKEKSDGDIYR